MVDFKYHVVSIVAVFLALAVGIVLGTNVLSGDVLKNLKAETSQLRKDSQALRAQTDTQQAALDADQAFAQAIEPMAVHGRLAGATVVVVMLPNAPKDVRDASIKTVTDAGATITGEVDITSGYVDPQQVATLDALATSLGAPVADPSSTEDPSSRAGIVLATALITPSGGLLSAPSQGVPIGSPVASVPASSAVPVSPSASTSSRRGSSKSPSTSRSSSRPAGRSPSSSQTDADQPASASPSSSDTPTPSTLPTPSPSAGSTPTVLDASSTEALAGMEKAGFIKIAQAPTGHATLALIIAPPVPTKPDAVSAAADKSLLDLISAFPTVGGHAVVAGAAGSAATGGVVSALRSDTSVSKTVTGVDNADSASGRISIVFALQAESLGQVGQFGTGPGAQGPLATPSPS